MKIFLLHYLVSSTSGVDFYFYAAYPDFSSPYYFDELTAQRKNEEPLRAQNFFVHGSWGQQEGGVGVTGKEGR